MTIEIFIEKLKIMFNRIEIQEKGDEYLIEFRNQEFNIRKSDIQDMIGKYDKLNISEETVLYNSNYYETIIDESGPIFRSDEYNLADEKNSVCYEVGELSDEYIIFIFEKVIKKENIELVRRISRNSSMIMHRLKEFDEYSNFIDIIRFSLRRLITIKIKSNNKIALSRFKELTDSLLFNISLNTGMSVIHIKYFEDIFGPRVVRNKRCGIEEVEPPQRIYISDLVYYYQMGISTFDPSLKFISFYHVIEYFFNHVYYESLVDSVRNNITNPKFSVRRDSDINELIKAIKKKLKTDSEKNDIKNEKEALKLTLKKYVNIETLKKDINDKKVVSLEYYLNNIVPFAKGDKVNFEEENVDKIFMSISNRIYKTRNAVIHSKLDEEERYIPFKHESQLLKEIPLIQTISEEIIISTSKIL
ncbi:MAG: hypothetical protein AB2392_23285 [Neobacillus sp.]